ncbi:hypothetical protein CDAR_456681 [Caerostris darwini]|uniref:Uncharacterized protein n=1 Tax=Caerostris darwini TaxID=1538125 RepID=A0AAV4W985_9ARAC|nr:hypothetical protein CDAR_456681 [Caerostris darwini]
MGMGGRCPSSFKSHKIRDASKSLFCASRYGFSKIMEKVAAKTRKQIHQGIREKTSTEIVDCKYRFQNTSVVHPFSYWIPKVDSSNLHQCFPFHIFY